MQNSRTIARPYAAAAFGWAQATDSLDSWVASFEAVHTVFSDLRLILSGLSGKRRLFLLLDSMTDLWVPEWLFFLKLLVFRGRFLHFPSIRCIFMDFFWQQQQVLPVAVRSAFALSDAQQAFLSDFLARSFSSKVTLSCSVDHRVIGGCVIDAHGDCYDASLAGRLEQLANALGL